MSLEAQGVSFFFAASRKLVSLVGARGALWGRLSERVGVYVDQRDRQWQRGATPGRVARPCREPSLGGPAMPRGVSQCSSDLAKIPGKRHLWTLSRPT